MYAPTVVCPLRLRLFSDFFFAAAAVAEELSPLELCMEPKA
jgi:hypothetical protein